MKDVQELELHFKFIYIDCCQRLTAVQHFCYYRHTHSFSPLQVALRDNINYIIFDFVPKVLHLFLEIIYLLDDCNHNCSDNN